MWCLNATILGDHATVSLNLGWKSSQLPPRRYHYCHDYYDLVCLFLALSWQLVMLVFVSIDIKKIFFFLLSWKCDFLVVGNEGDRQLDQKPAWRILADSSRRSCTHYWSSVNSPMCWSDRYPRLHDHLSVIASLLVGDSLVQWSLRSLILLRWWSSKDSYFLWHIGLSSYQEDSDPRLCQKDEAVCLKI